MGTGISMKPTTNRLHQSTRKFFLIAALALVQLFAVTGARAQATACPCSLFSAALNPGDEAIDRPSPAEPFGVNLGVKFHSDVAGYVKAIRFYKHIDNTGVHTAYLWDANGNQLATATFQNETAT